MKVWNQSSPFPTGAVYIGRGSKWGNPYRSGIDGTRAQVIQMYQDYILKSELINDIHELTGKDLLCFCKPLACHGDVLMALANPQLDV